MSLELRETKQGVIVKVRVSAGSRESAIRGIHDGALKIAVRQVAEKEKANKAVIDLLAKRLNYPISELQIVSGSTRSEKQILFAGAKKEQLNQRIGKLLHSQTRTATVRKLNSE